MKIVFHNLRERTLLKNRKHQEYESIMKYHVVYIFMGTYELLVMIVNNV